MSGFSPCVAPPQPQPALSQPGCQVKGSFGAAVNSKEFLCPTNSRSFPGESPTGEFRLPTDFGVDASDHHYLHWTYHPFWGTSPGLSPQIGRIFLGPPLLVYFFYPLWLVVGSWTNQWKNMAIFTISCWPTSPRLLMASQLLQHYIPETGSMLKHIFHAFNHSSVLQRHFYSFPVEHGSSEVVVQTPHFYHPSHCVFYISTMILIFHRLISHSQRSYPTEKNNPVKFMVNFN